MWFNPTNGRRPRSTLIAVLLLLTLGVTSLLAWQAYRADVSHAAVAEQVLDEYAMWAAGKLASLIHRDVDNALVGQLAPIECHDRLPFSIERPGEALAGPVISLKRPVLGLTEDDLRKAAIMLASPIGGGRGCSGGLRALDYFRLDLFDRTWLTGSGRPLSPSVRLALEEKVIEQASMPYVGVSHPVLAVLGEGLVTHRLFAFVVVRGRSPMDEKAFGFEVDPDALSALVDRILDNEMLLPGSLMKKAQLSGRDLLSAWVLDYKGQPIFQVEGGKSPFAAKTTVDPGLGRLIVYVAIVKDSASSLVIGGLPGTRLPLLVGLLALTIALVAIALVQLKREYELVRLRADFVSSVSHELRTPLAQIRLFGETLLLGRVRSPDEGRRALEIIDQESKRLAQLVENVLLFSRSERRVIRLKPEPTHIATLIAEIVDGFEPLASARDVEVEASFPDGAQLIGAAVDRSAFRQMLLNLLDNAVKYGPVGQTVTVALDESVGRLRVSVSDQGPGIPAKSRERIFRPFFRLERERETAVAGAGIGLSVVRDLAVQHGGRALVEEAPGGGARFVIELPGAWRDAPRVEP